MGRPGKDYGKPCRHCKKVKCNRPRGLCWSCYYTPGVKELYPPTSKYARRGVGLHAATRGEPKGTKAPPGSSQKKSVMAARAAAGLSIFGTADVKDYEDPAAREKAPKRPQFEGGQHGQRTGSGPNLPRFFGVGTYSKRSARLPE